MSSIGPTDLQSAILGSALTAAKQTELAENLARKTAEELEERRRKAHQSQIDGVGPSAASQVAGGQDPPDDSRREYSQHKQQPEKKGEDQIVDYSA